MHQLIVVVDRLEHQEQVEVQVPVEFLSLLVHIFMYSRLLLILGMSNIHWEFSM